MECCSNWGVVSPLLHLSSTPLLQFGFASLQPADVVLPTAHGEALIGVVNFQLRCGQISGFAVKQSQMIPFTQHGEARSTLDDLLDAFADNSVAVGAHQHHWTSA